MRPCQVGDFIEEGTRASTYSPSAAPSPQGKVKCTASPKLLIFNILDLQPFGIRLVVLKTSPLFGP